MARGTALPLEPDQGDSGQEPAGQLNNFGFDLLRRMDTNGNLCFSPTSIAFALGMVRAGARAETASQMDKVLYGFGGDGEARRVMALLKDLQAQTFYEPDWGGGDPEATAGPAGPAPIVELTVSNQVFSQKGMALSKEYLDLLSAAYDAGVGLLNFEQDPEGARATINRWASLRTKGRIPEVLKPGDIDDTTRITLANAIYFKAGWTRPFSPADTKPRPFTRPNGSRATVPTMRRSAALSYYSGRGYRAVVLPFSASISSDALGQEMVIVVPDSMAAFTKILTHARLKALIPDNSFYSVDLTLPRFSLDTRVELSEELSAMGMTSLFDPVRADLTGITAAERLYVKKVIHQANIDVVEDGTTAAAVSIVVAGTAGPGGPPPPPAVFHIDRPFLYFIRDIGSGAILFMGRVNDPSVK